MEDGEWVNGPSGLDAQREQTRYQRAVLVVVETEIAGTQLVAEPAPNIGRLGKRMGVKHAGELLARLVQPVQTQYDADQSPEDAALVITPAEARRILERGGSLLTGRPLRCGRPRLGRWELRRTREGCHLGRGGRLHSRAG